MKVAIIPARGGSKRIPKKNIKYFLGKPIITYPVELALKSNIFDHVIVSTDDDETAAIVADIAGCGVLNRPKNLADDYTPTVPVISHAIVECEKRGWKITHACCIYPATPFLVPEYLHESLKMLNLMNVDFSFPIVKFPSSLERSLKIDSEGLVTSFFPEFELRRSQDLADAYYDAGQFYWGKRDAWLTRGDIHAGGLGYIISPWRAVDIDTQDDWVRAEILYKVLKEHKND